MSRLVIDTVTHPFQEFPPPMEKSIRWDAMGPFFSMVACLLFFFQNECFLSFRQTKSKGSHQPITAWVRHGTRARKLRKPFIPIHSFIFARARFYWTVWYK